MKTKVAVPNLRNSSTSKAVADSANSKVSTESVSVDERSTEHSILPCDQSVRIVGERSLGNDRSKRLDQSVGSLNEVRSKGYNGVRGSGIQHNGKSRSKIGFGWSIGTESEVEATTVAVEAVATTGSTGATVAVTTKVAGGVGSSPITSCVY